jgi:sugar lactone lactonase YvrE
VADAGNGTIRKMAIATGAVSTFAGTAGLAGSTNATGAAAMFNSPQGVATDGTNLYVADSADNTIRQIVIATGAVTTLAGTAGAGAPGYADGISSAASFNVLQGITSDGTNLYLADSGNSTIRKIVIATGAVTTLAGKAGFSGYGDGIGSAASFYNPQGITTDGTNLYVTDASNSTIRQIVIATGAVTTLAGSAGVIGSSDGTGLAARFYYPQGITTDGKNLYVTDASNSTIRQIVIATGAVTTLAGKAGVIGDTDGTGLAARFYYPQGITTDGKNLYVTDSLNNTIRKVVIATGAVTTLTGIAGFSGYADGTGLAATLSYPTDVTTDGTNLYVADSGNNTIRKIVIATGAVTTLAGSVLSSGSVDGISSAASFKMPQGITTDGTNLYVADSGSGTIRKIVIATGAVITLAGKTGVTGHANGIGATASFSTAIGITTDGTSLYTVDSGNNTIRKIQ